MAIIGLLPRLSTKAKFVKALITILYDYSKKPIAIEQAVLPVNPCLEQIIDRINNYNTESKRRKRVKPSKKQLIMPLWIIVLIIIALAGPILTLNNGYVVTTNGLYSVNLFASEPVKFYDYKQIVRVNAGCKHSTGKSGRTHLFYSMRYQNGDVFTLLKNTISDERYEKNIYIEEYALATINEAIAGIGIKPKLVNWDGKICDEFIKRRYPNNHLKILPLINKN